MNYDIVLVGDGGRIPDLFLGTIRQDPVFRFKLGNHIHIKGSVFEVVRLTPTGNPSDQKVTYFVEPLNVNKPYRRQDPFRKQVTRSRGFGRRTG